MEQALGSKTNPLRNTAVTAGERIEHDSIFDRDSGDDLGSNHPEWCVDVGDELKAMNKFELWLALGTGDVGPDARVWKVGRERWQPACEIPDLACALKLHAQVLMATLASAEAVAEEDRVTLVPGRLPSLTSLARSIEAPTSELSERTEDEHVEEKEVRTIESDLGSPEPLLFSSVSPKAPEVEAKSVTPGPATVELPETIISEPLIRARRGLPRRKAISPWSGVAALGALVATSLLTLPSAFKGAEGAAAELPSVALLLPAAPSPDLPPSRPTVESLAPATIGPLVDLPAEPKVSFEAPGVAETPASAAISTPIEASVAHVSHPSKHHVRPSSVSPSHRGQDRKRRHDR